MEIPVQSTLALCDRQLIIRSGKLIQSDVNVSSLRQAHDGDTE
jgi:ABC-type multidrug transport system ATPase subunit